MMCCVAVHFVQTLKGFKLPVGNAGKPTSAKGAVSNGGTGGAGVSIDNVNTPTVLTNSNVRSNYCSGVCGFGTQPETTVPSAGFGGGGSGGYGDAGGGAGGQINQDATDGFTGIVAIKWD
jgi:hypothetical protein